MELIFHPLDLDKDQDPGSFHDRDPDQALEGSNPTHDLDIDSIPTLDLGMDPIPTLDFDREPCS